ncbi:phosphoribosylamine--glycine ligase [Candidatus Gottesmanbacteria bacterium RIFCSPLOWO2_01_FULL_39_12b]|uniref:Phosphoribosylamine--glycine ligase n=1 Tax=Candidatus Gottesmanbacteria bacterium RIFCSPLOWO2_01_FULL_39_12b TaxID=1798388 RepID=A0A1F6AQP9_9BACT|nr:MAG: phosphoribosylamine--glycine ligase [Candidatus Gottesmanbacteria bacterium RIFCSPLOWO2_01_FULL_39_12b]
MKVLVIGSGGREHALVWKIAQSKKVKKIFCAPGNPGMILGSDLKKSQGLTPVIENIPIQVRELDKLLQFAKKEKIDLTVVGQENPLISGIADLFVRHNLPVIGPTRKAARIEGSKVFAKKLMEKYGIPTAKFEVFDDYNKAIRYAKKLKYPQVVKADGQCLGKGVAVCDNYTQAEIFLKKLLKEKTFGAAGEKVIIEECLQGQEISYMVATDGYNFVSLLPSQDHKRVFDNDCGPNTGGMGAYAPVPFVNKELIKVIEDTIVRPTLKAMRKEGNLYEGILYPGLILTKEGPKVLEYNCRFGDPETQPLMRLLKTDIIDIFEAIINKSLKNLKVEWHKGFAVCVVLTAKGYPGEYEKGKEICRLKQFGESDKVRVFQAGTERIEGKTVGSGGRILGVTASGVSLKEAIHNTYESIGENGIHFSGMHYRKDIGMKGLMND